jgi:cyanate permease
VLLLALILALVLLPTRFSLPLSNHGHVRSTTSSVPAPPSAARLAAGCALHSLASTGVFLYLMWYLVERGLSFAGATAIAGVAGAAQVPGRILSEPLRRAVGGAAFLPILLVAQAVALFGVVFSPGTLATAWILVFGAVSGMMTLERATVIVEWYGRSTFGAHQGRLATATGTARAISPFVVEAGHRFLSYAVVFGLLGIVLAVGAWIVGLQHPRERRSCVSSSREAP